MKNIVCGIDGCGGKHLAKGYCNLHYHRLRKHGNPRTMLNRPSGQGTVNEGYVILQANGRRAAAHILVAEKALGRALPNGAVVHHVDENGLNNSPTNLVICPSIAYHLLIHLRMRALEASGRADWRKCSYCKKYDDTTKLNYNKASHQHFHSECRNSKYREYYAKALAARGEAAADAMQP